MLNKLPEMFIIDFGIMKNSREYTKRHCDAWGRLEEWRYVQYPFENNKYWTYVHKEWGLPIIPFNKEIEQMIMKNSTIIGYKLLKDLPDIKKDAIFKKDLDGDYVFIVSSFRKTCYTESEVLNEEYFIPIYEEKIMIGDTHEVILKGDHIIVNGEMYTIAELEAVKAFLTLHKKQIKSINAGCSGQYEIDLVIINKILNKL